MEEQKNQINENNILEELINQFIDKKRVVYVVKNNHDKFFNYLHAFIHRILSEIDLSFLTESLYVIILEIATNFLKAIAKRIYYTEKNLDIYNLADYNNHITHFKKEILENWDKFQFNLQEKGYFLTIEITIYNDFLIILFKNNIKVNIVEKERIQSRISQKQTDNYLNNIDSSEGGGLGLIMIQSILENSGIGSKNIIFDFQSNATISLIKIPLKLNKPRIEKYLKNLILEKIETLPTFPEHIQDLIQKCEREDISYDYLAEKIKKDPALTSHILKLGTSAGYITRNKNPDLLMSLNLIGLNQLKHLITVYAAKSVVSHLVDKKTFEKIWYDSNRIAFFSRNLQNREELKETVFLIGILNLIGKIVIFSLNNEEINKIRILSKNKVSYGDQILEEIEIGISYSEVGAVLAKLWNFPEPIIYGIQYQFKPLQISEDKIDLVYPVYLAKCINEILNKQFYYEFIEYRVLKYYGFFNNEKKFLDLIEKLNNEFTSIYI